MAIKSPSLDYFNHRVLVRMSVAAGIPPWSVRVNDRAFFLSLPTLPLFRAPRPLRKFRDIGGLLETILVQLSRTVFGPAQACATVPRSGHKPGSGMRLGTGSLLTELVTLL